MKSCKCRDQCFESHRHIIIFICCKSLGEDCTEGTVCKSLSDEVIITPKKKTIVRNKDLSKLNPLIDVQVKI